MGDSTAVFGVTDMDYVDFLPSTSATSYYDDDEVGGGGLSSNNCTQVIKQLTLEPQPLRINPIYNKVTLDYTATHPGCYSAQAGRLNIQVQNQQDVFTVLTSHPVYRQHNVAQKRRIILYMYMTKTEFIPHHIIMQFKPRAP